MKKSAICFLIVALLFAFSSCDNEIAEPQQTTGTIQVAIVDNVSPSGSRGIEPQGLEVTKYQLNMSGPQDSSPISVELTANTLSYTATVLPGTWAITVKALNADNIVVGSGSTTTTIVVGQTVTCQVTVAETAGDGQLNINFTDSSSSLGDLKVLARSTGGQTYEAALYKYNNMYSGSLSLPNGFYALTITDGSNTFAMDDSARIYAGLTTQFNTSYDGSRIDVSTVDQIIRTPEVRLDLISDKSIASNATLEAAVSVTGLEGYKTAWTLDAVQISTENPLTYSLSNRTFADGQTVRLTVFVTSGSIIWSDSVEITVTEAVVMPESATISVGTETALYNTPFTLSVSGEFPTDTSFKWTVGGVELEANTYTPAIIGKNVPVSVTASKNGISKEYTSTIVINPAGGTIELKAANAYVDTSVEVEAVINAPSDALLYLIFNEKEVPVVDGKISLEGIPAGTYDNISWKLTYGKDSWTGGTDNDLVIEEATISLWYGAAITEAGPIPDDWIGYQILLNEHNIDLKLSVLPSNESDQDVRIQAAAAGNSLPDLFMVSRPVLERLVDRGLVAPVGDYYALMPTRTAQQYDADSISYTTIDGKSYGFSSPASIAKNEGLLIRKDWLDKLGLQVPTTTEELMEVMKAFTYKDPDGNGIADTWGYGAFIESDATLKGYPGARLFPILGAYGVDGLWCFEAENLGLNVYKNGFYDAMVYIRQMISEGVINPDWATITKDSFRAGWKNGKYGIIKEQNAAYAAQSNYAPFDRNFPNGEWIVIDPPVGPTGKSSVGAYDQSYRIYAMSQDAVDAGKAEKICELLEWMSSDEGYYLCGWGQEGINYVLDANGVPVTGELGDNAFSGTKGQVYTQLRNMVFYNSDTELASRYPTYTTAVSGKTMSALVTLREMQSKYWTPAIGSGQMPTPSSSVMNYYNENLEKFLTGEVALTEDSWSAFLSGFNSAGGSSWNQEGIAYANANGLVR